MITQIACLMCGDTLDGRPLIANIDSRGVDLTRVFCPEPKMPDAYISECMDAWLFVEHFRSLHGCHLIEGQPACKCGCSADRRCGRTNCPHEHKFVKSNKQNDTEA